MACGSNDIRGVPASRFRMYYSIRRIQVSNNVGVSALFNVQDLNDYDYVRTFHALTAIAPNGFEVVDGKAPVGVTETRTTANYPSLAQSDVIWFRITCDGTTQTVACVKDNSGTPSDSDFRHARQLLRITRVCLVSPTP